MDANFGTGVILLEPPMLGTFMVGVSLRGGGCMSKCGGGGFGGGVGAKLLLLLLLMFWLPWLTFCMSQSWKDRLLPELFHISRNAILEASLGPPLPPYQNPRASLCLQALGSLGIWKCKHEGIDKQQHDPVQLSHNLAMPAAEAFTSLLPCIGISSAIHTQASALAQMFAMQCNATCNAYN